MYGIMKRQLEVRAQDGNPIRVGFVGAGRMGSGAICQSGLMSGMTTSIIADLDAERAARAPSRLPAGGTRQLVEMEA